MPADAFWVPTTPRPCNPPTTSRLALQLPLDFEQQAMPGVSKGDDAEVSGVRSSAPKAVWDQSWQRA